jgi:hypothetical protein
MGSQRRKRGQAGKDIGGTVIMTVPSKGKGEFRGTPTTRNYPRTMAEAFPKDPHHAEWWYPPEKHRGWGNAVMLVLGIMLWAALFYLLLK